MFILKFPISELSSIWLVSMPYFQHIRLSVHIKRFKIPKSWFYARTWILRTCRWILQLIKNEAGKKLKSVKNSSFRDENCSSGASILRCQITNSSSSRGFIWFYRHKSLNISNICARPSEWGNNSVQMPPGLWQLFPEKNHVVEVHIMRPNWYTVLMFHNGKNY